MAGPKSGLLGHTCRFHAQLSQTQSLPFHVKCRTSPAASNDLTVKRTRRSSQNTIIGIRYDSKPPNISGIRSIRSTMNHRTARMDGAWVTSYGYGSKALTANFFYFLLKMSAVNENHSS
jgi:hypothetical protein